MSDPEQAPRSLVYPPEWDAMTADEHMMWFLAHLSAQLDSIRSEFAAARPGDPAGATSRVDPATSPATATSTSVPVLTHNDLATMAASPTIDEEVHDTSPDSSLDSNCRVPDTGMYEHTWVAAIQEVITELAVLPGIPSSTTGAQEVLHDASLDSIDDKLVTCSTECSNQDIGTGAFPPPIMTVPLLSTAAPTLVVDLFHSGTDAVNPIQPFWNHDLDVSLATRHAGLLLRATPWPSFLVDHIAEGNDIRSTPWPSFACSHQGMTLNLEGLLPQVTYGKKNLFGDLNCLRASWNWRYLLSVHLKPYSREKVVGWIHTVARANSVIMRLLDILLKLCSELPNGYLIYMDFINIALMGSEVIHRKQINHKGLLSYSCYGLQPWGGPEYFTHGADAYELYLEMLALVRTMWKSEHCWVSRLCHLQRHNKLLEIMCAAPSYSLQMRIVLAMEVFRGLIRTTTAENNGPAEKVSKVTCSCDFSALHGRMVARCLVFVQLGTPCVLAYLKPGVACASWNDSQGHSFIQFEKFWATGIERGVFDPRFTFRVRAYTPQQISGDLLILCACLIAQHTCVLQSGCTPNGLLPTAPFLLKPQLLWCPSSIVADFIRGVSYAYCFCHVLQSGYMFDVLCGAIPYELAMILHPPLDISKLQPDDYNNHCLLLQFISAIRELEFEMATYQLSISWDPAGLILLLLLELARRVGLQAGTCVVISVARYFVHASDNSLRRLPGLQPTQVPSTCYNQGHFQEGRDIIPVAAVFAQVSLDHEYYLGFDHGCVDNGYFLDSFGGSPIGHNYCPTSLKSTPASATSMTTIKSCNIDCNGIQAVMGGIGLGSSRIQEGRDVRSLY